MQKNKGIKKLLQGKREKVILVIEGDIYFYPMDDIAGKRTKINYAVDTQDMDCFGFSWKDFYDGREWQHYYKIMIELATEHITYAEALKNANAIKFQGEMNRALNLYYNKCDDYSMRSQKENNEPIDSALLAWLRKNHFDIICKNVFTNGSIVLLLRKNYNALMAVVIKDEILIYDHANNFLDVQQYF